MKKPRTNQEKRKSALLMKNGPNIFICATYLGCCERTHLPASITSRVRFVSGAPHCNNAFRHGYEIGSCACERPVIVEDI